MNPERWSQIDNLFDASLRIPPSERDEWLKAACHGDHQLQSDVQYLLSQESEANRSGFLTEPTAINPRLDVTAEWHSSNGETSVKDSEARNTRESLGSSQSKSQNRGDGGFSPKAVIASGLGSRSSDETRSVIQSRLRELPLIHVLIFGVMLFLRPIVLGVSPSSILTPFVIVALSLVGVCVLLTTRSFTLERLRIIEFGVIAALAFLLVTYEARALTDPSLQLKDRMYVQLIMKNVVLLTSVLMLTDGIYVPKGWKRAACVAGMLALLPIGTLFGVSLFHPESVHWVVELRSDGRMPLVVFCLDALFLVSLAAISSFAAHTISRLRLEVVEARQFGQYRLGRLIGTGGMGDVYLAEHQLLKRDCAVKLIRPDVVLRAGTLERFEREVRINATLSHPNTVEIFDYGRTEDGTYYYVMEFLPGMSLAELVERHGPLPPERAVYLLRQVAMALHEAHGAGLIHRDIKPSNIFAAKRGGMDDVAKLLDFGLVSASAMTANASQPSDEGQILGTPLYMSPEQASGSRKLDARSDIYSLGAVAYYLLTGHPPFEEATAIEAIVAHVRYPVVPPSQVREGLPDDLERVVLRCLAKNKHDRFEDAESLELAMASCECASGWDKHRAADWWRAIAQERDESQKSANPSKWTPFQTTSHHSPARRA
ncbi:serine/threonine-protein kinase [Singulisphaera sp. PoT]|uniref:serine/threonine-protein kinase n=1 Tax=Singulisphaera sp. PoT TaxID=3411797 RepID=UPI003BF4D8C8